MEIIKRFLYVEDGSVDVDTLREELGADTYVIVYRQGSNLPRVEELVSDASYAIMYKACKD